MKELQLKLSGCRMTHNGEDRIKNVPLSQIELGSTESDFDSPPDSLRQSIQSMGILQPLVLTPIGEKWKLICGNRRFVIAGELSISKIPVRIFSDPVSKETRLRINLEENRSHRTYSDVEKAAFIFRLRQCGVDDDRIIDQYMPTLKLQPEKKLLLDYLATAELPNGLKQILHELNVPHRVFAVLFRWNSESLVEAEAMIRALRPGVNKMKESLEWIDEIAGRENISPAEVVRSGKLQTVLSKEEPRYSEFKAALLSIRFPELQSLRKKVWLALDRLQLESGTKIKTDENFEKDDIHVGLNFQTLDELQGQIDRLFAVAQTQAMRDLIETFQKLKGNP
tara:strand:- start:2294 stop:3307 length:1014 start_codon:yes stop_codon:yes gene_type:complete